MPRKVAVCDNFVTFAAPPACAMSWIVVSGSAFGIVRSSELDALTRSMLTKMAPPTPMMTTGDKVDADAFYEVKVLEVGIRCDALVLKISPSVLTFGKRDMEEGLSFRWDAGHLPTVLSTEGEMHLIVVLPKSADCPARQHAKTQKRSCRISKLPRSTTSSC